MDMLNNILTLAPQCGLRHFHGSRHTRSYYLHDIKYGVVPESTSESAVSHGSAESMSEKSKESYIIPSMCVLGCFRHDNDKANDEHLQFGNAAIVIEANAPADEERDSDNSVDADESRKPEYPAVDPFHVPDVIDILPPTPLNATSRPAERGRSSKKHSRDDDEEDRAGPSSKRLRTFRSGDESPHSLPSSMPNLPKSDQVQAPNASAYPIGPSQSSNIPQSSPLPPPPNLSIYASHTISENSNRGHVIGLRVTAQIFTFYYFDRAGSICSEPLDIANVEDLKKLVECILRMSCTASIQRLGYETLFQPPEISFEEHMAGHLEPKLPDWRTVKEHRVEVEGQTYTLDRVLYTSSSLYGRGTFVYTAKRKLAFPRQDAKLEDDAAIPSDVVIKCSWQVVGSTRSRSNELYKLAAERNVSGVVKLYASKVVRRLSDGRSPRGFLVQGWEYRNRELKVEVMGPLCIPLHEVSDVSEFRNAFISLVKGTRLWW